MSNKKTLLEKFIRNLINEERNTMKKFFIHLDSIECANFIRHINDDWYEVYLWLKNEKKFDDVSIEIYTEHIFDNYQDAKDFIMFTLKNSAAKLPEITHTGGFYPSVGDEFYDIDDNKIVIVKVTKIISNKEVVVKQFNPNTKSYSEEYITQPRNFRTTINRILESVLHELEKDRLMFYDNNLL